MNLKQQLQTRYSIDYFLNSTFFHKVNDLKNRSRNIYGFPIGMIIDAQIKRFSGY